MSEMIERVAIAIAKIEQPDRDYISLNQFGKEYYQSLAKAAMEAMREPTDEMMAGVDCAGDKKDWESGKAWRAGYTAMIEAALNEKSPATP